MMRVLWFTSTSYLYELQKHQYHGCGWVESLQTGLVQHDEINLAVSFFHTNDKDKKVKDNTTYYPLYRKRLRKNPLKAIFNNFTGALESERETVHKMLKVIEDFNPDIINVFGSEDIFSSIQQYTKIPVVIHIQGVINPIIDSYFPPGVSKWDFLFEFKQFLSLLTGTNQFFRIKRISKQGTRELNNLKNTRYVFGRTDWDYCCMTLLAPKAKYFHINEMLREDFYDVSIKKNKKNNTQILNLVTTLSSTIYKGLDVILKTALLLSKTSNIKICWRLIGVDDNDKLIAFFEQKFKVNHKDLGIKCMGVMEPKKFIPVIKESDLYVHTSYIENSPNSICEAQIIGTPVIATNAGGVSSIVEHNKTGVLIPLNGVFELSHIISNYNSNLSFYQELASSAKEKSIFRHDRKLIVQKCIESYCSIIDENSLNSIKRA